MVDHALEIRRASVNNPGNTDTTAASVESEKEYEKISDDMAKESGYEVPGQTKFKIVFESDVLRYSKVEFESWPFRGRVGWVSIGSFVDPRADMP